jgi:hypothetical protein
VSAVPEFRQGDADELHRVTGAVFGTWERRDGDGPGERLPGILERLERLETLLKVGVGAAGAIGAFVGSMLTLIIQHWMNVK